MNFYHVSIMMVPKQLLLLSLACQSFAYNGKRSFYALSEVSYFLAVKDARGIRGDYVFAISILSYSWPRQDFMFRAGYTMSLCPYGCNSPRVDKTTS